MKHKSFCLLNASSESQEMHTHLMWRFFFLASLSPLCALIQVFIAYSGGPFDVLEFLIVFLSNASISIPDIWSLSIILTHEDAYHASIEHSYVFTLPITFHLGGKGGGCMAVLTRYLLFWLVFRCCMVKIATQTS